ncbi:MAG: hypothetical protein ACLVLJ_07155 [Hydrogeniiclostridium mannosilyticum]
MIKHMKKGEQEKQNLPCGRLVQFYYNEERYMALQEHLQIQGSSVENELFCLFNEIYRDIIPKEKQAEINERINCSDAEIPLDSYILFHVRENGVDSFFVNNTCESFYGAARRYLEYLRKHSDCCYSSFTEALYCEKPLSASAFERLTKERPKEMTDCISFDLDNDTVRVLDDRDKSWQTYTLDDMVCALFAANDSKQYELRPKLFFASLKEIKSQQELIESDTDNILQM